MCLFKRKAGISGNWFIRELIDKNSYAICFQCYVPGGICSLSMKSKCIRLIKLHGGLTYKSKYAYVKKEI